MLKVLEYSVSFPTTGRSFENRIEFAPGLTAITGRNEAGKSVIFEMIGYCFFGTAALRGKASDYKSLSARLEVVLNGKEVVIERAKKETLWVDGEEAAVGAAALNKEIPRLLGFGLEVFNIACAAQQGDLGALTEMRPTARKAMVDQLIGLDRLEDVERKCREQAKAQETVAQSLAASAVEPVPPVKPDDYEPSETLEQKVAELQDLQRRREELLRVERPEEPVEPEAPEYTDVEALEKHEAERQRVLQERARLEGQLAAIPEPTVTRDELEKAVAYQEYQDEVRRRGPKPEYSVEQLRQWEADWRIIEEHMNDEVVTCPHCNEQFVLGGCEVVDVPDNPPINQQQIYTELRRHDLWAEPLEEVEVFTLPNIQQEIMAYARKDERANLRRLLEDATIPADLSGHLRAARDYQRDLAVFRERKASFDRDLHRYEAAQEELATLPDRGEELEALRARVHGARHFEALQAEYERDSQRYAELAERVAECRELADGFNRGALALRGCRASVKAELAPSLSYAASSLISSMTGGERNRVEVDEDFEVIVDGQPLQTLSGSGKSVVNLALRLGLGQVLTARVLPIFLGDEIDADCDSERAGSVAETLQTLRHYLEQIIIITHKGELEADTVIRL